MQEEQGKEYKYDDNLVLEMSKPKYKLFEILLESLGKEALESKWVKIKLIQINKYFIQHENACDDCPLLQKALKHSKK